MSKKPLILDLEVAFGGVSIGDKTARVGVSVGRKQLSLAQADKNLCDRRLVGSAIAKPAGDQPDQDQLDGFAEDVQIDGIFDVKGIAVSTEEISFGLTFFKKGLDMEALANFAKRAGWLKISETQDIPSNGEAEE